MQVQRLRAKAERSGAAAVEMALVLPVFMALVFGQIEASRMGMVSQSLTAAAREGGRVAALPGYAAADVQTTVSTMMTNSGITGYTLTISPSDPTTVSSSSSPNTISVTISVPFSSVSWSSAMYFKNTTLTASATFSSERP